MISATNLHLPHWSSIIVIRINAIRLSICELYGGNTQSMMKKALVMSDNVIRFIMISE